MSILSNYNFIISKIKCQNGLKINIFCSVFVFFFLVLKSNFLFAQSDIDKKFEIVYDFSDDWLIFNQEKNNYFPLLSNQTSNSVSISLPLKDYKNYSLHAFVIDETYLYINNRLTLKLSPQSELLFNIDSLNKELKADKAFLTFYRRNAFSKLPKASIVYVKQSASQVIRPVKLLTAVPIIKRQGSVFKNFMILSFVFLFCSYAFLLNFYPKVFEQYFQINNIFGVVDKTTFLRSLSRVQLLFILNHSLLLSLGFNILKKILSLNSHTYIIAEENIYLMVYNWIAWALVIFCLIMGKYILINVLGNLLRGDKVVHLHFYRHISLSQTFYLFFVTALFYTMLIYPLGNTNLYMIFWSIIVSFQIIRMIIITIGLNKIIPFYNMYFFSYICATEAIPVLLGFKYFSQIL